MKKAILLLSALLLTGNGHGKSMADIWKSMPDSFVPYLTASNRQTMTDYMVGGGGGETTHLLQGKSKIDTLTADFIRVTLNNSAEMQIKRLPYQGGDSILCVVKTWLVPEAESEVTFYTQDWKTFQLRSETVVGNRLMLQNYKHAQPDSMTAEEYEAYCQDIDFMLVSARLSAENDELVVCHQTPLAAKEDKEKFVAMQKGITLKWNGTDFEE